MVKAKKHLGQHFLKDEEIAKKIVDSLHHVQDGNVIEIGAGTGILTKYLLGRFENFRVYEVDKACIHLLKDNYHQYKENFHHQNFLTARLPSKKLAIIGNFPYNISSQIFFKLLDAREQVIQVVGMVQKEVADRIVSPPRSKNYGILSVLLQTYFEVELLFEVPPAVFVPPPKVMSSVVRLSQREVKRKTVDYAVLKRVVKAAFGKRRKTLRNALKVLNLPNNHIEEPVFDLRAEQLSVENFISLINKMPKKEMNIS